MPPRGGATQNRARGAEDDTRREKTKGRGGMVPWKKLKKERGFEAAGRGV